MESHFDAMAITFKEDLKSTFILPSSSDQLSSHLLLNVASNRYMNNLVLQNGQKQCKANSTKVENCMGREMSKDLWERSPALDSFQIQGQGLTSTPKMAIETSFWRHFAS